MRRKTAREIFGEVDPKLRVIPGGGRRRKGRNLSELAKPELPYYQPHKATEEDWDRATSVICSRCGGETFVTFNHTLGRVCKPCYLWLLDNWIDEGEQVTAKLAEDGRILIYHGKVGKG